MHVFSELRRQGIVFQPLVWSAEGRPHPSATRILECTVAAVGRKRGAEEAAKLRMKWYREITIATQRRKAEMMSTPSLASRTGNGGSRETSHCRLASFSPLEKVKRRRNLGAVQLHEAGLGRLAALGGRPADWCSAERLRGEAAVVRIPYGSVTRGGGAGEGSSKKTAC